MEYLIVLGVCLGFTALAIASIVLLNKNLENNIQKLMMKKIDVRLYFHLLDYSDEELLLDLLEDKFDQELIMLAELELLQRLEKSDTLYDKETLKAIKAYFNIQD